MRVFGGLLLAVTAVASPDAANFFLTGRNYFMSGDFDQTIRSFEKALAVSPASSDYELWLGRAWGRRAENGNWVMVFSSASKARQCFERPAEYEFEEVQLADHRKDYAAEETHLRRAMELAPREAGRVLDLARFLSRRGRLEESDLLFERAAKMAPGQPKVAFAIARADIEAHRNRERARRLLREYLDATLTPDDPPRHEAEKLLRRAGGS